MLLTPLAQRNGDFIIGHANQGEVLNPIGESLLVFYWSAARPLRRHARFFVMRFADFFMAALLMRERARSACFLPILVYA